MRQAVLRELYLSNDEYVSGNQMAVALGISRVAVWKHIEALKSEGYAIESHRHRGYRLLERDNIVWPDQVQALLKTDFLGRKLYYYAHLDSTNNKCKEFLREEPVPEGLAIVSGGQGAGRGRKGRLWESPPGGLYFSVLLAPALPLTMLPALSLVFAAAVSRALEEFIPEPCQIKWPNDVLIGGQKAAGILLEAGGETDSLSYLVTGIGINVNNDFRSINQEKELQATSLMVWAGHELPLSQVLAVVFSIMEEYYLRYIQSSLTDILPEYKSRCLHLGQEVEVWQGREKIKGTNIDIDLFGNLLVKNPAGIVAVNSGDLSIAAI